MIELNISNRMISIFKYFIEIFKQKRVNFVLFHFLACSAMVRSLQGGNSGFRDSGTPRDSEGLQRTPRDSALLWSPGVHAIIKFATFHNQLLKTKEKYDVNEKTRVLSQRLQQSFNNYLLKRKKFVLPL